MDNIHKIFTRKSHHENEMPEYVFISSMILVAVALHSNIGVVVKRKILSSAEVMAFINLHASPRSTHE